MKPVLLILDTQNDFFGEDNPNLVEFQRVIPTVNSAIAIYRKYQHPIVFIQHTSENKQQNTYLWEIYREFDILPQDLRLQKSYSNAFWESKLDTCLKDLQVDFVVIAGFVAEYCVLSTYRGAKERDYEVAILQNGIASIDGLQRTKFVFDITDSIPLDELSDQLISKSEKQKL